MRHAPARVFVGETLFGIGAPSIGLGAELDVGGTASATATAELKSDISKGDLDAPGAADTTAKTVATAAGAAGAAAACAAVGAAVAAPLCATIGGEIAGAVYGAAKKFLGSLFGGESAAAKAQRKLRAAQSKNTAANIAYDTAQREVMDVVRAMMTQIKETDRELGVSLSFNEIMDLMSNKYGLPVTPKQRIDPNDPGRCIADDRPFHDMFTGAEAPGPELIVALPGGCALQAWRYRAHLEEAKAIKKSPGLKRQIRKKVVDEETALLRKTVEQLVPYVDLARNATALLLTDLTVRAEIAKVVQRRRPPALAPVPAATRKPPAMTPVRKPPAMAPVKPPAASAAPAAPGARGLYGPYPQARG